MDDERLIGMREWKIIGSFAVIFIIATIVASVLKIKEIKKNSFQDDSISDTTQTKVTKIAPDNLGIKSLKDTYDSNDLKITYQSYTTDKYDKSTYPVISGLKDKDFENEINNAIKSATIDTGKKVPCYLTANFSNVLSIYYYTPAWEIKTLNYDLLNKKELKFEDLFTNTASIKQLIYKSAYNGEARTHANDENARNELKYSEEEGFKAVSDYINGKEIKFYFSANKIYFNINNRETMLEISIQENYKDIAIFNRFKTVNSVFDGSYEGLKNIKIGINTDQETEYLFKELKDNLYVCYAMPIDSNDNNHLYDETHHANTENIRKIQKALFKIWENDEKNIAIYDDMGKCFSKIAEVHTIKDKQGGKIISGEIHTVETQSRIENYEKYMDSFGLKGLTYTQVGYSPAYFDYENKWTYNEEIPPDYEQKYEDTIFIYDTTDNTLKIKKFTDEENGEYSFSEYDADTCELKRVLKMKYDSNKSEYVEVKEEPKVENDENTITVNELTNEISANNVVGPDNNIG